MTTQSPWREQSPSGNPPTEDRATPGTLVGGRYELITAIGHGGMGTVWRSTDTLLRREVAVKEVILPPTMPQHEKDALCERTMREARAAAAIAHPSVVAVFDVVTDANRPWIVMELLEARSLADMVIDDGPLSPRAVAKIGIAMLGALEVAHAVGVLHRDVKPANVLVCDDGRCVLTDFGVARLPTESKLTTPGMVLGSPHFISPERAVGGAFGPPSDLFSLGVTLYTAVEGGPPFDRGDPFETMRAVVEEAPRPARLAGPLKPILWGLLEKEPDRRWDVDRARTALRELLSGQLAPPRPTGAPTDRRDIPDEDPTAVVRPSAAPASPPRPTAAPASPTRAPVSPAVPPTEPPTAPATPPVPAERGAVGGRAMLDPAESLTDQLARLRAGAGLPPEELDAAEQLTDDDITRRAAPVRDAGPGRTGWDSPSRADRPSWAGGESWGGSDPATRRAPRKAAREAARERWAADPRSGHTQQRSHIGRRRAPTLGSRAWKYVQAPQHRSRVVVVAGLVTVLLAVGIAAWAGAFGSGSGGTPPVTTTPAGPQVQEYRDRGIAVNVPAGWEHGDTTSYVDFRDLASNRWVRIHIEPTTVTATRRLENAESALKQDPTLCVAPYTRLGLREGPLAGVAGAELEFTCGEGATKRHGVWRAVVRDGTAYHFYLTALETDFAASMSIYDEMVRSFQFV